MSTEEPGDDTVIWRYMSFTKLVSMLKPPHTLFFSRPFKFDDNQWEGLFPPSFVRNMRECDKDEFQDEFMKRQKRHKYAHFVNCWHISKDESDAMWRLYGLSPEGVAIQSTAGSVRECLRPHNYGAVKYYDPAEDFDAGEFPCSDILFKRKCFSYEKEYRVWFDDEDLMERIEHNDEIDESRLSPGKPVSITATDRLVRRLVVAPGAEDWFIELVKSVCGAYRMNWLGSRVERSPSDRSWDSFTK
jgi:hypothetical protein